MKLLNVPPFLGPPFFSPKHVFLSPFWPPLFNENTSFLTILHFLDQKTHKKTRYKVSQKITHQKTRKKWPSFLWILGPPFLTKITLPPFLAYSFFDTFSCIKKHLKNRPQKWWKKHIQKTTKKIDLKKWQKMTKNHQKTSKKWLFKKHIKNTFLKGPFSPIEL